jgi:hypothetical protein
MRSRRATPIPVVYKYSHVSGPVPEMRETYSSVSTYTDGEPYITRSRVSIPYNGVVSKILHLQLYIYTNGMRYTRYAVG